MHSFLLICMYIYCIGALKKPISYSEIGLHLCHERNIKKSFTSFPQGAFGWSFMDKVPNVYFRLGTALHQECSTEYETVAEEKCESYSQSICTTEYETVYDSQCSTDYKHKGCFL